jgi:superfamily I DNA/RNA helicase
MVDEATLVSSGRGSVIAPAGCGKTELVAKAAALGSGRALVLTHTHAGVKALRDRLRRLGVPLDRAQVDTIAGFGLKYCRAYPTRSRLASKEPVRAEWDSVYEGAEMLLDVRAIRQVIESTYACVYVDEYQDCTRCQHRLVV